MIAEASGENTISCDNLSFRQETSMTVKFQVYACEEARELDKLGPPSLEEQNLDQAVFNDDLGQYEFPANLALNPLSEDAYQDLRTLCQA